MGILEGMEPREALRYFEEISAVPRGSEKEEKIADYLIAFAEKRGLSAVRDKANNVLIRKPAYPGYENCDTLILQGHSDMVCAREEGVDHDFEREGLDLYVENGLIRARGTTLGADNGIALAYGLAILDSQDIPHPPIEVVFTAAEEIGMVGAKQFDLSQLRGTSMISFDSGGFTEGRIYVGCAGGDKFTLNGKIRLEERRSAGRSFYVEISGLKGGHSGGDINKGRGNASVLMGRLLHEILREPGLSDLELLELHCGDRNNPVLHGIPDRAYCVVLTENEMELRSLMARFGAEVAAELGPADPDAVFKVRETEEEDGAFDRAWAPESVRDAADILLLLPCGVLSMHKYFTDTPETSCNVGSVEQKGDILTFYVSSRSSKESGLDFVEAKIRALSSLKGLEVEKGERIPGWEYQPESRLKNAFELRYEEMYGRKPNFKITHASTECGVFKKGMKDLDVISIGPIIYEEHTTREYMEIHSVNELWKFLLGILEKRENWQR